MAHFTAVKRLAKKMGASFEDNSTAKSWEYRVEAPHGKLWNCDLIHELVLSQAKGNIEWLRSAIVGLLERMKIGLCDCDIPDCEWCEPELND